MLQIELGKFERIDAVYKSLDGIPFEVAILVPKAVISSQSRQPGRPLLVHFHGGGFVLGTALDPQTLPIWTLQLAESRGAIVISPCHRLLPEATGSQIIEDINDFWAWLHSSLAAAISTRWHNISVDYGHIATAGQGSGGSLALQSAFPWPEARIKLIMAQYCAMDPDSTAFNPRPHELPRDLDAYVSWYLGQIKPGTFRVSSPYPENVDLLQAVFRTGRWRDLLGSDKSLRIREALRQAKQVPPIWIAQGANDQIVSRVAANELVDEIRTTHPYTPVMYTVVPGGHGFDLQQGLQEDWVQDALGFVDDSW